jgi:hypothetical protein
LQGQLVRCSERPTPQADGEVGVKRDALDATDAITGPTDVLDLVVSVVAQDFPDPHHLLALEPSPHLVGCANPSVMLLGCIRG